MMREHFSNFICTNLYQKCIKSFRSELVSERQKVYQNQNLLKYFGCEDLDRRHMKVHLASQFCVRVCYSRLRIARRPDRCDEVRLAHESAGEQLTLLRTKKRIGRMFCIK